MLSMTAAIKPPMEVSDSPISGSLMWLKKEPSAVNMSVPANKVSLMACEQTEPLKQQVSDACIGAWPAHPKTEAVRVRYIRTNL